MLFLYAGGSGSPIEARQTAPIYLILITIAIIFGIVIVISLLFKKYSSYLKSEAFLTKEQNRLTTKKDVQNYTKENNLSKTQSSILWEVCQITKCKNIAYSLKNNTDVNDLFRNAYNILKQKSEISQNKLEQFFETLFKLELIVAQIRKVFSTMQIPPESVIFYISDEGEQYPFTIKQNTKDFFIAEIPSFLINSPAKPKILVRTRFTFKTSDGLSYNFISRIIRYETLPDTGKTNIIISHTDQLECQAQRHFKREFFQEKCVFSSVKIDENDPSKFKISENLYDGKLSNISAGGCCIQTKLPVKEKQHIRISIPNLNIDENIIGIIRRTRKLPTGVFALHIQFIKVSTETKNKIYALVYKYEL